jgi:hypothetical protein
MQVFCEGSLQCMSFSFFHFLTSSRKEIHAHFCTLERIKTISIKRIKAISTTITATTEIETILTTATILTILTICSTSLVSLFYLFLSESNFVDNNAQAQNTNLFNTNRNTRSPFQVMFLHIVRFVRPLIVLLNFRATIPPIPIRTIYSLSMVCLFLLFCCFV